MNKYFNEIELNKILSQDKVKDYSIESLNEKFKYLHSYLLIKKISEEDIKSIILNYPRLLTYTITFLDNNYNNLEKYFKKNTNKIVINNPRILSKDRNYTNQKLEYLKEIVGNDNIKISLKFPEILTLSNINIEISLNNLKDKIKDEQKLLYVIKRNPNILSFTNKMINSKINWFYDKGYNKKQTVKIITKAPSVLTMEFQNKEENIDSNIEQKYNFLLQILKYKKEEIIEITNKFPVYYTLSLTNITNKLNYLLNLGFTVETVKSIFYTFPQIISFSDKTLKEKYEYYLQLDLLEIFIKSPKYLMQRTELTDARYKYIINKNLEVNKNNYGKLFLSSKKFKKTYGIDNKELLKQYKENGGYYEQGRNKKYTK